MKHVVRAVACRCRQPSRALLVASSPYHCVTHGLAGITVMLPNRSIPQASPEKHEYSTDAKTWPSTYAHYAWHTAQHSAARTTWKCGLQSGCAQRMIYRVDANNTASHNCRAVPATVQQAQEATPRWLLSRHSTAHTHMPYIQGYDATW
jgi:hypothetical protein